MVVWGDNDQRFDPGVADGSIAARAAQGDEGETRCAGTRHASRHDSIHIAAAVGGAVARSVRASGESARRIDRNQFGLDADGLIETLKEAGRPEGESHYWKGLALWNLDLPRSANVRFLDALPWALSEGLNIACDCIDHVFATSDEKQVCCS